MSLPSALVSASMGVTTTPTALPSHALSSGVIVRAAVANSVPVMVGNSSTQAYPLNPGEAVSLVVSNTDAVYVVIGTGVSDQSVAFLGS